MQVKVYEVYAFTNNGEGGNRAGVVLDASKLSDDQMQLIAHAVGASETAFVLSDKTETAHLRFFTPTVEVPLCGHATIATWSLMHKLGLYKSGKYTQVTGAGIIHISVSDDGLIFMEQPKQKFRETLDPALIADELAIPVDIIDSTIKPQIVQHALMLGIKSKEILNRYILNKPKLLAFNKKYDFKGLHMFVILKTKDLVAAVRDFDPIVGIDEDAATGTTNGSFLTYLRHYNALPRQEVHKIEQGEALGQLSHIYGKFKDDRVWIGGYAQDTIHELIELI
jgi:PhzF family phenazine biosynthesis protein